MDELLEETKKEHKEANPAGPCGKELLIVLIRNIWRTFGYYIFFFSVFTMYELLLRLASVKEVEFTGLLFAAIFNLILILLLCYVMSFIPKKARVIASNIVLAAAAVFYISQIIYYNVFETFYNPESMTNAGQIIQFWAVILKTAWNRVIFILLCIGPIPVYNLIVRKTTVVSIEKKLKKLTRMEVYTLKRRRHIKLAIIASVYAFMIIAFIPFAKNPDTAYSVFFGQQSYKDSIKRTGLLSTLQIDMLKLFIKSDMSGPLAVPDNITEYPPAWGKPKPAGSNDGNSGQSVINGGNSDMNGAARRPDITETTGDEQAAPPATVEDRYNAMDIDFNNLIANESNDAIISMHEYFAYIRPAKQNEYTGIFKGFNLIMFTAEGFSQYAVNPELTPTLYKLVNEGFHFTDFYTPIWEVSTSDGEYVACTGLLPKSGVWSFRKSGENYMPFVMGNQLKKLGYQTNAYHNHTYDYYDRDISHPNMGYEYKAIGNGLVLAHNKWPNSDLEMMEATIDEYINNQPFHAYYMTVSGHLEYNFIGNDMAILNKDAVAGLPYSDECKAYIACNIELDKALEFLLMRLRSAGIADKTLIVLSSDHYPYGLQKESENFDGISEFLGRPVEKNFELYKNNLIIYVDGMAPVIVDEPCSSLDIIPTVSNLMGLEYDSRLLMGRDILGDAEPLVIFNNRDFITDKGHYTKSEGFVPNPGAEVDDDYIRFHVNAVDAKFKASARILDLDYYSIVPGR